MSGIRVRSRKDLKHQRRRKSHSCWDHLLIAPLWPMHNVNLGTLLRTCDAVGACLAVPKLPWVPEALAKGNTLRRRTCVHWTGHDPVRWLIDQRSRPDTTVVGVELADEAVDQLDVVVEIPMIGTGASLNVAVAGSLVLYRLAGLL